MRRLADGDRRSLQQRLKREIRTPWSVAKQLKALTKSLEMLELRKVTLTESSSR